MKDVKIIKSHNSIWGLNLGELFEYRDLLLLFVKRDIVTVYKQTILGPIWYFVQPIITTVMYTFVFGKLASLSTNGVPHVPFYLIGVTLWSYFAECLNKTSNTFVQYQGVFGKVYFPRLITPLSIVLSRLGKLCIQTLLFILVLAYYIYLGKASVNIHVLYFPLAILQLGLVGLGFGLIFSALTTKYRDLTFLLGFGVQLWMYATPIIYPLSTVPARYRPYLNLNPISPIIENVRFGFFGEGSFSWGGTLYSSAFGLILLLLGVFVFNKIEKSFMDSV